MGGCTSKASSANDVVFQRSSSRVSANFRNKSHANLVQVHTPCPKNGHFRDVYDDYKVIKKLGTGSLGSVDMVVRRYERESSCSSFNFTPSPPSTPVSMPKKYMKEGDKMKIRPYALKSITTTQLSEAALKELLNEVNLLRTLDHPNIVRLYSVYESPDNIYLVMQCCVGGDLYSMVPYTEAEAARITASICSAISYMHSRHITHRDLKFENVIFEKKGKGAVVKVIDFGLGRQYAANARYMFDICGTLYTMSPQVLKGTYTHDADVWAIGVMTYMLLSNRKPFYHADMEVVIRKIVSCDYTFAGKGWDHVSEDAKTFVSELLVADPLHRLSAAQACNHKWLKDTDLLDDEALPIEQYMDILKENMSAYAGACEMKRLALTVVAHKSTSEELLELHKAFKKFDTARDGVIRKSEFVSLMKQYNYEDEEIESMFTSMDVYGDGFIQYVEFIAATLEACGQLDEARLLEAFNRLDVDSSGFISKENLRHILGLDFTEEKATKLISQVDVSKNGQISYADFLKQFQIGQKKLLLTFSPNLTKETDVFEIAEMEMKKISSYRMSSSEKNEGSPRKIQSARESFTS